MPNVCLDDCQIEYDDTGSGLPLIFCHEFAGSMESWDLQKSYFLGAIESFPIMPKATLHLLSPMIGKNIHMTIK